MSSLLCHALVRRFPRRNFFWVQAYVPKTHTKNTGFYSDRIIISVKLVVRKVNLPLLGQAKFTPLVQFYIPPIWKAPAFPLSCQASWSRHSNHLRASIAQYIQEAQHQLPPPGFPRGLPLMPVGTVAYRQCLWDPVRVSITKHSPSLRQ